MKLTHDVTDDSRRLDVTSIWPQAHLGHLIQDAPLNRFEAVASVGERTRVDHRIGVLKERALHFGRDIDVFDSFA
jgi:hypothetical protein